MSGVRWTTTDTLELLASQTPGAVIEFGDEAAWLELGNVTWMAPLPRAVALCTGLGPSAVGGMSWTSGTVSPAASATDPPVDRRSDR